MNNYYLGWQSWSPLKKGILKLPLWDYSPANTQPLTHNLTSSKQKSPISLWCSWHSNGININENLIIGQAQQFKDHKYIPEYFLIDDGWCTWGDWNTPEAKRFPSWDRMLTNLKKLKYKIGLWISPFLVDSRSTLFKTHPRWIVKHQGKPLNAFMSYPIFKELTPKYLLDFTNPEVVEYLHHCLDKMIKDWGISLLKIDHLYAPYFAQDTNLSSKASGAIIDLFNYLKTNYPDVYTIACGCPFDVAEGRVDTIRISKDINSPQIKNIPLLNSRLYLKRKKLLNDKLQAALSQKLPFGIDIDAAINPNDAKKYHDLWKSGKIQVFGIGYNL